MATYFANDGNYGDAFGLFTCDTREWTEEDWQDIELSPDSSRVQTAIDIASKYA